MSHPESEPRTGAEAGIQVTTEAPSRWGRILTIEFPRGRYEQRRQKALRDLRRRVARPGFRKGHVPAEIIERDFGDQVRSEVLEKLIPEVCSEAIASEQLDIISAPSIKSLDLDHPQVVRMDVEVDIRPEFTVMGLDNLEVEKWQPEVRDEDVERALESIRDEHATFEAVDREAQDGDFVVVSYTPLDDGGQELEAQKVENYPFQLGQGQVVADFEAAVRGRRAGDTARAEVRYADDHPDKTVAGKLVAFVLTVQEVKEKRLPEVDDEFARDLEFDDLEALKTRVREDLGKRLEERSRQDMHEALVDRLLTANAIEVPQSLVERFLDAAVADYDERRRRAGLEPDPAEREELRRSAVPSAEQAARRLIVLDKLEHDEGLAASEEEVDRWIEERAAAAGDEAGKVRGFFADPKHRRRLRDELTQEKVLAFLEKRAKIREVPRPASTPVISGE